MGDGAYFSTQQDDGYTGEISISPNGEIHYGRNAMGSFIGFYIYK